MPAYVDLEPGDRLMVSPPGDPLGPAYEAAVRAILPSMLRLAMPRRDGVLLPVAPGDELAMFTLAHGRVFRFSASVRLVEEENDCFFIDTPRSAERTERREFFRLVTRIPARSAWRLDDAGEQVQELHCVILDLSGGGALLQSREFVPGGSRLRLVFGLEGDPFDMDIGALVLSCVRPSTRARHYQLHCQFMDPSHQDIERLVRYVYRQQAELRRKGVI